jgi:hypothetical protein
MSDVSTVVAATVNITCYKGDTLNLSYTLTDSDTGDAIDLSGADIEMQVRQATTSDTALLTLDLTDGLSVGGAGNNIVAIEKVITLTAGKYRYDMQFTLADSTIVTYFKGKFIVIDDVTE